MIDFHVTFCVKINLEEVSTPMLNVYKIINPFFIYLREIDYL